MLGFNKDKDEAEIDRLRKDLEAVKSERERLQQRNEAIERRLRVSEAQRIGLVNDRTRLEASCAWSEAAMKRARNEELRTKRNLAESNMTISEHRMAIAELKAALAHRTEDIEGLQSQLLHAPSADAALTTLARAQADLIELIQASLTCPMCFEYISKGDVISLACGHSFCTPCIDQWSITSVTNQMRQAAERQSKLIAPECPECRGDASKKGRVKVYMLEDVVRAVQRWDEERVRENMRHAADQHQQAEGIDADVSDRIPREPEAPTQRDGIVDP